MSNNNQGPKSSTATVQRGTNPSPAGEDAATPIAASHARTLAPALSKPSWLDNGFMGSRRTTNRDVLVEGTLLVGSIVVATAAAYGTAYALQRMFGDGSSADAALIGGDAVSL